ncbi:hypothetical protein DFJ73DRAFT_473465 [Zopfochytrium polystomum]|nr:hypothetical protein DFJ73DRAFT_473465 [Zopfochytrium polystomum]
MTPNLATFQALVMLFQCCRETPDLNTAAAVLAIANQVAISLNVNHPSGPWMHPCITSQLDLEIAGRCWWSCYVANTSCPVMGTDPFPDIRMKPVCPEAEWLSLVPGTPVVRSSVFREMLYQNENPFNFLMSICQILNRIFRLRSLARDPTGGSANAGPSGMAKTSANSSVNDEFCRLEDQLVEWIRMLPSHLWLPIPDEAYVLSAEGDLSVGGANMLAPFFDDSEDEVEVAAGRGSTLVSPSSALSGTPPWCVLTLNFVYFACVSALHLERLYAAVRSIPSSPSSLPSNYGPGLAFPSSSDSAYSTSSPSNIVDTNKPESRLSPAHSPRLAAEPNAPRPSLNSYSAVAALRNSSMSSAGSPISAATVGGSPNPVHSMTPAGITRVIWNVGRAPGRSRIQFEKSLTILRSSCKSISILNLYLVRFLRRRGLLGPSFGSVTGTSGMEISPGSLKNPLTATPPTSATISPTTTLSALPSLTAHGSGTAKPAFVAAPTPAVLCPRLFGWSLFIGTLSTAAITLASLGPPPPPSQPPPPQSSTSSMAATSPSTVSRDTLLKLLLSNVDLLVLSDPAMSAILHPLLAHIQDRVGAGSFMVPLTAPAAAAACPPTPQSPVWVPGASVDMRRALEACVARVKVEAASIPVRNGVWPGKIEIEVRQLLSVFTGSA